MSKEKKVPAAEKVIDVDSTVAAPPPAPPAVVPVVHAGPTKLSDVDKLTLDLARSQRATALEAAKAALAQNEKAELQYKYVILQIYMKYGLTEADALSEAGDIVRGGAVQKPQGQ